MPGRYAKDDDALRAAPRDGGRAWLGWVMLALVALAALGATGLHLLRQRVEEQLRQRAEEQLGRFAEEYRQGPLSQEARRAINYGVDAAFAPVYAGIPDLLDWHYSFFRQRIVVIWQSREKLEEEIESRLFGSVEEEIDVAVGGVGSVMQEAMLADLDQWFARDVDSVRPWQRADYARILDPILADARRRITASIGPTVLRAAMADPEISLGENPLERELPETGISMFVRWALRALMLHFVALPSVIPGVAVSLILDFAYREAGELLGREDLEQELIALVDAEKERVKSALSSAAEEVRARPLPLLAPGKLHEGIPSQSVLSSYPTPCSV